MKRFPIVVVALLAMGGELARAQFSLPGFPGAAPAPPPAPAKPPASDAAAPPTRKSEAPKARKSERSSANFVARPAAVAGKPLRLDGSQGQLLFSDHDKDLRIDKFSLPGEVISNPSQKCLIDIVGEAPIETKSLGRPEGLERYEAEIPACPFSFDLLDGAVLVPPQGTACVFQAADCQASPSGLWGPDGATVVEGAKSIARQRSRADAAAARSLRALQARLKGSPEADDLAHEQNDFATRREDVCRNYVDEALHGYCASRMAQARAAQLKARIEALARHSTAKERPATAKE